MANAAKAKQAAARIFIEPSKRGSFTKAAKAAGMSVQAYASHVLANKDRYSAAMVKKAQFAKNAKKFGN